MIRRQRHDFIKRWEENPWGPEEHWFDPDHETMVKCSENFYRMRRIK